MLLSVALLDHVPAEEVNRMAYKDMNTAIYVIATLSFYTVIVTGSILIKDIAIVFDYAGAVAVSAIAFFLPAYLYPAAVKKFNVEKTQEVKRNICVCYFFRVFGWINFTLGILVATFNLVAANEETTS